MIYEFLSPTRQEAQGDRAEDVVSFDPTRISRLEYYCLFSVVIII